METNLTEIRRRSLLGISLGAFLSAGMGLPSAEAASPYPQLVSPAIKVRNPTRVYMVASASNGQRIFAGGEHGVIIYSEDGGKSWTQASVPVSVTITDIAFATPQIGWATGGFGVVLGTIDGGTSWVKQLDGLQEITLMNAATQAFVAAQPADSDAAAHATRRAQILTGGGPDKPLLCVLPVSATEVFAFGTYRFAEHSTDGGKSWTDWSMNIGDPTSHNIYGAAAIDGAFYLVGEESLIFRSTDGGKTFPQLAQPGQATFFGITDTGSGILAYGVAGQMYLSTDDGKTWNAPNFTGTANVNSVAKLSSGLLIAGDAGGGLWISLDHGKNFKQIFRNPLFSINAIQPVGPASFLLLSEIGIVPIDLSAMRG